MAPIATARPEPVRQPFMVIIAACPLGIHWVTVEPRTPEHGGMGFVSHGEAQAYAEALSCITSWPVRDRCS